jgi:nitroreductase
MTTYDPKNTPWQVHEQDFPQNGSAEERLRFLVSYAILAPSSHNTQPWRFMVGPETIQVFRDTTCWLSVADADQRELHISIGCAIENLCIAAEHFGYTPRIAYLPTPDGSDHMATVRLENTQQHTLRRDPALFGALTTRHTNHKPYTGQALTADDLRVLEQSSSEEDITLWLTDDSATRRRAEELITQGDARQFANPAYRAELGHWIGQGVFGTPWLLAKLGQFAMTHINMSKNISKQDSELLLSAPVLGLLTAHTDDPRTHLRVGQVFERLALTAALRGIQIHPMSQGLEVPDLRREMANLLPEGAGIPQHAFRLGYAEPEDKHTPRRPLDEVLVESIG